MALHRKMDALLSLHPDIAIIPECAAQADSPEGCSVWVGSIRFKGLAVLSFGDYRVALDESYDPSIQWAAPVRVTGPNDFFLLAIWGQRPYGQGVQTAIETYRSQLSAGPSVVAGDFNQNSAWDARNRPRNHTNTVEMLGELGLISAYHHYFRRPQGRERHYTHYWRGQPESEPGFHIDYCFLPEGWLEGPTKVKVGTYAKWIASGLSDHVPLVVEVEVPRAAGG